VVDGAGGGGSVDSVGGSVEVGAGSVVGSVVGSVGSVVGSGVGSAGSGSTVGSVEDAATTGGSASLPDAVELSAAPAVNTRANTNVTPIPMATYSWFRLR
jgi:hypothetical protein